MSMSLYNPFMVNLDFASRMARLGGGGGSGPSQAAIDRQTAAAAAEAEAARKAEEARKAAEAAEAAEAARKAEEARKAAEEAARKEAERQAKAKQMAEEAQKKRDEAQKAETARKLRMGLASEAAVMSGIEAAGDNARTAVRRRLPPPVISETDPSVTTEVTPDTTSSAAFTMANPVTTAGESAMPEAFTYRPDYTGTTMANLTSASQIGTPQNIENVMYTNEFGQTVGVTEINGEPTTYVPPGYTRFDKSKALYDADYQAAYDSLGEEQPNPANSTLPGFGGEAPGVDQSAGMGTLAAGEAGSAFGFAEGGTVPSMSMDDPLLEAKFRIASMNGYNGPKTNASLNSFANSSEGMKRKFNAIGAVMANKGGYISRGLAVGGVMTTPEQFKGAQQSLISQTMQPIQGTVSYIQPQAADFVAPSAGQTVPQAPFAEASKVGSVEQAKLPEDAFTTDYMASAVTPAVKQETAQLQAEQGTVAPEAQITAAQQQDSSVTGLQAAQGQAVMVNAPAAREIQQGEIISGVADAQKASQFNEQIQAAEATPTKQATVQGQLEDLMQQFEGGETPAWAAGSMRTAMANLSARGLGASSMAGQAVIQAAMEAALPIAQIDAQTQAQFESQNLSNRQQRAILAAQQRAQFLGQEFDQQFQARVANSARIGDIANMNFTAEQNIALENSRAANTMELNNLSNRQAMVMAEAASLANLDMANLNNRQQAAVQNAQNFLQMDMQNLNNEQQTAMFKSQQNVQALFTDQAADNAAKQFNAASENQTTQFFANLSSQTSQFNAAQTNAMNQFNVNSVNALREFNSEIQQQRDMFNAQNGLVVAQANAQWRQNIATINTTQQNESNSNFAKTINGLTANNLDQIWQRERDIMSFAFSSAESAKDRALSILLGDMEVSALEKELSAAESRGKTKFLLDVFEKPVQSLAEDFIDGIFGG